MLFLSALARSETQTVSSTIWTQVADSIAYNNNHYAKGSKNFNPPPRQDLI